VERKKTMRLSFFPLLLPLRLPDPERHPRTERLLTDDERAGDDLRASFDLEVVGAEGEGEVVDEDGEDTVSR
jgi:hypothetical protein